MRTMLMEQQIGRHPLLAMQSDEMLALAIKRNFFFREAFDEFCCRFTPRIRSWLMCAGT